MKKVYLRFPGFKGKALTLSYDDGVEQDQKFVEIINKGGLKCTFNLNSSKFYDEPQNFEPGRIHRIMTEDAAKALYTNSGHEVAVHYLDHAFPYELSATMETMQIYEDRKNLEEMFGTIVRGMAYPYGHYTDQSVEIAKNCGIVYSRTTQDSKSFRIPRDWLRLKPTCHHTNEKLDEYTQKFLSAEVVHAPILFYLWGHTYEFEQNNDWHIIEDFTAKVGNRDDIWYATNIEVHDYVEAYRSLHFSVDCSTVFNPTAFDIYLHVYKENKDIIVHPGETVTL